MEQVDIKTPEHVTLQYKLAGLGSRAAAQIIDQFLLSLMTGAIFVAALLAGEYVTSLLLEFSLGYIVAFVIILSFLIFWGYFFLFEWLTGGKTPGKMLLGLRVIREQGGSATVLSIFLRNLVRIIDMLPFYYFLGMVVVFFHPKHKRIGDLVAGTIVVHEGSKRKYGKKKPSPIEKEIQARSVTKEHVVLDDVVRNRFTNREWKMIQTYAERFLQLPQVERERITHEIAEIICPLAGIDCEEKDTVTLENIILAIYLNIRDDWEI